MGVADLRACISELRFKLNYFDLILCHFILLVHQVTIEFLHLRLFALESFLELLKLFLCLFRLFM